MNTQMCPRGGIIHTLFHEQAVCIKGCKMKKSLLVSNTAIWVYHSFARSETMSLLFKDHRWKLVVNGVLELPCDFTMGASNRNKKSLR